MIKLGNEIVRRNDGAGNTAIIDFNRMEQDIVYDLRINNIIYCYKRINETELEVWAYVDVV